MRFVIKTKLAQELLQKTLLPLEDNYQAITYQLNNGVRLHVGAEELEDSLAFYELPIIYGKIPLAQMKVWCAQKETARDFALLSAPVLYPLTLEDALACKLLQYFDNSLDWIDGARSIAPKLCDWIGIYFQASHLTPNGEPQSLWVAPYRGEATEHMDIPVQSGLCGLAFRERRIVNMADVHADPRHIACSLKTRSELILPLYDRAGLMVAELDIDSWTAGAFTPEIEELFVDYAKSFRAFS
jgi:putative methionine-R-sulfoxide reductase with GAF domain